MATVEKNNLDTDYITIPIDKEVPIADDSSDLRLSEKEREVDYGNGWTESSLDKFEELLKHCKMKVKNHADSSNYFSAWYRYITYPNIILSTALTMLTTYNTSSFNSNLAFTVAGISGVNSLVTGFSSFWEYSKRAANHNSTSLQYSDLARQITTELFLPINERNNIKYDFDVFSLLLQNIESSEPPVPGHIIKKNSKA